MFVDEITAAWLTESCPEVTAALREEGAAVARTEASTAAAAAAAAHETAIAAARTESATAERARVLGIQSAALSGHAELVARLIADPSVSLESATSQILAAEQARQRAAGTARVDALVDDEKKLNAPPPAAPPSGQSDADAAKAAVALAVQLGIVR